MKNFRLPSFVIILIGVAQDKIFIWLDRRLFKYKYANEK